MRLLPAFMLIPLVGKHQSATKIYIFKKRKSIEWRDVNKKMKIEATTRDLMKETVLWKEQNSNIFKKVYQTKQLK